MSTDVRADLDSLIPDPQPLSRRNFVGLATITAGFALAVQPVMADTRIITDTQGLIAGTDAVSVAGGMILPVYVAAPEAPGPHPLVLVVQEIFGVHEYIRDICRRLAKLGYVAIAPELYFRQGNPATYSDIPTLMRELVARIPDDQVLTDLDATVDWAIAQGKADPSRIAITGFCWGGRITWLYAAQSSRLKAGIAWYGRLTGQTSSLTPRHPLDIVSELKAPMLGLYGGADQGIPVETVEKMRAATLAVGKTAEIVLYPEMPHAFHADYRPSYRETAARDGWQRLQGWLTRHGV